MHSKSFHIIIYIYILSLVIISFRTISNTRQKDESKTINKEIMNANQKMTVIHDVIMFIIYRLNLVIRATVGFVWCIFLFIYFFFKSFSHLYANLITPGIIITRYSTPRNASAASVYTSNHSMS